MPLPQPDWRRAYNALFALIDQVDLVRMEHRDDQVVYDRLTEIRSQLSEVTAECVPWRFVPEPGLRMPRPRVGVDADTISRF